MRHNQSILDKEETAQNMLNDGVSSMLKKEAHISANVCSSENEEVLQSVFVASCSTLWGGGAELSLRGHPEVGIAQSVLRKLDVNMEAKC